MKKHYLVIAFTSLFLALSGVGFMAYGADIVVSVTVPDAYVTKLTNMVTDKWLNEPTCAQGGPAECSDAQYENQEDCELNEETWAGTPLNLKQCFIKKMIVEAVTAAYATWEREQEPATAKATFNVAKAAYKAALRNAETAEVDFDVTGE